MHALDGLLRTRTRRHGSSSGYLAVALIIGIVATTRRLLITLKHHGVVSWILKLNASITGDVIIQQQRCGSYRNSSKERYHATQINSARNETKI